MSSVQGSRRATARKPIGHRRLRRNSVKKSLKFDDGEQDNDDYDPVSSELHFPLRSTSQGCTDDGDELPECNSFWGNPPPPPPLEPNNTETTVNRRSLRLRTKNQFAFSQIADRLSPKLCVNAPTSDQLLRKRQDVQLQNNNQLFSDYGTSSECSALYFQPSQSSSCSSVVNTKLCFDTVVRNKLNGKAPKSTDAGSQSLGYSSDLDDVMSNLSIDEINNRSSSEFRRWDSDEECLDEDDKEKTSHLSLDDLKISSLKASLKIHDDIRVLTPLQGYEIAHTPKCAGRRSHPRSKPSKALRYDLRKRPGPELEKIITIETFDINIEEIFLKSGLRIFQVSPIISIQPHEVKFCTLYPAFVQIPLNIDPSSGDEVHCLYSRSAVDNLTNYSNISWSSEMAGKCSIKDGKVNFETFQFGVFVLVIRPKCPYSSSKKNIRARVGGKLLVSGFPNVEVSFPKEVTEQDILRANANIYFDTEESVSEFVAHHKLPDSETTATSISKSTGDCLATPIIQLEPHGIHFEGEPVVITLPVPDYDQIVSLFGSKANLSIWQSNTHSSEPSNWEKLDVKYHISHIRSNGETTTVVTFPVTHFSFFKGVWEAISEYLYDAKIGMLYYFVSFAMKCQANMQEYPDQVTTSSTAKPKDGDDDDKDKESLPNPIKGGSRFGLEVIIFQADKPWPPMSTYQYKVGQSNPKLVKTGKICVRLKSHYFEPDVQAGEEEEMLKEESDFRGRDFEKQFICKFKPDVNIERGPFGKVLVTRHVSPRQKAQPIFEFNIQKHGNERDFENPSSKKQNEEQWSMVALTELANSLFVTEGDNWKQFALEIGMTKQEIKDARLKYESQPFQKIVSHYRQRGGSAQELVDALYRSHRTLKVGGHYSGQGSNHTRSSNGSSGRGSLSSNNAHFSRVGSHDSDTSGTQTSQDSGLPPGRKRSHQASFRGSGAGGSTQSNISKLSKRRRLSPNEPSTSTRLINATDGDVDSSSSSSSESDNNGATSMVDDFVKRNNHMKLKNQFLWDISDQFSVKAWRAVGRTLGVEESTLIEVDQSYSSISFRECAYQMLLGWRQRHPESCTFGNLYSAFLKEGMDEAAKKMSNIDTNLNSD